jgi:hypothetical protein
MSYENEDEDVDDRKSRSTCEKDVATKSKATTIINSNNENNNNKKKNMLSKDTKRGRCHGRIPLPH